MQGQRLRGMQCMMKGPRSIRLGSASLGGGPRWWSTSIDPRGESGILKFGWRAPMSSRQQQRPEARSGHRSGDAEVPLPAGGQSRRTPSEKACVSEARTRCRIPLTNPRGVAEAVGVDRGSAQRRLHKGNVRCLPRFLIGGAPAARACVVFRPFTPSGRGTLSLSYQCDARRGRGSTQRTTTGGVPRPGEVDRHRHKLVLRRTTTVSPDQAAQAPTGRRGIDRTSTR